ncbi:MAG: O-antigen ligase family protein [Bacteroidales bacterium]|jgi:O-antigen ligase|nr:O-antigen ligase family protein [Bacteroidales bacterium]
MKHNRYIFFAVCFIFVALNCYAITRELFVVSFVSVGFGLFYLLFFRVDLLMYLMAIVTPFSVIMELGNGSLRLSVPAEPVMILLTGLFICRIIYDLSFERKLWRHPISIAVYVYMLWMFITCLTSELPLVSFKFLLSKIWFIVSSYFMLIQLIKNDIRKGILYFSLSAAALAIVVSITIVKHAMMGFSELSAHWIMSPFYNDHTAYGAIIALFLPFSIGFIFLPNNNWLNRLFFIGITLILLVGFYLSFSRAAWLSFAGAVGIWAVLKLRIKLSWLVVGMALIGAFFYYFTDDILYRMSRNEQDSSGNIIEHLQSITNIKTDASNVERLNRWVAAFDMIKERPVTGWGPGTYQFVYAPFQKSSYKTIITTDFGDGGNAHSEYIGPCAETGFVGLFTVLALLGLSLYYGIITYIRSSDKTNRLLSLCASLALVTYYIHGFLNNFLDTDKLSMPFWGCFAIILVCNTLNKKEATSLTPNSEGIV